MFVCGRGRRGLWEAMRPRGWSPHEWDECPCNRLQRAPCPLCRVRAQRGVCHPEEGPTRPYQHPDRDFQSPEPSAMHFCCLSATQLVAPCDSSPNYDSGTYVQWSVIQPCKGSSDTCYKMRDPGGLHADAVRQRQTLGDFTYMRLLEQLDS